MQVLDLAGSARDIAFATVVVGFGIPLSVHDVRSRRLPNHIVGVLSLTVLALSAVVAVHDVNAAVKGVQWALLAGVPAIGVALLAPRVLGMGDAKLIPGLALAIAMCSRQPGAGLLLALWVASTAGSLVAMWHRLRTRTWPLTVAYGPHLLAATAFVCLLDI